MVYLLQLLCPQRHAMCAVVYDSAKDNVDEVKATIRLHLEHNHANDWCGICGSTLRTWDNRPLPQFATCEEVLPLIRRLEAQNIATRAMLDAMGLSYDARLEKAKAGK